MSNTTNDNRFNIETLEGRMLMDITFGFKSVHSMYLYSIGMTPSLENRLDRCIANTIAKYGLTDNTDSMWQVCCDEAVDNFINISKSDVEELVRKENDTVMIDDEVGYYYTILPAGKLHWYEVEGYLMTVKIRNDEIETYPDLVEVFNYRKR